MGALGQVIEAIRTSPNPQRTVKEIVDAAAAALAAMSAEIKWTTPGTVVTGKLLTFEPEMQRKQAALRQHDGTLITFSTISKALQPLFELADGAMVQVTYMGAFDRAGNPSTVNGATKRFEIARLASLDTNPDDDEDE